MIKITGIEITDFGGHRHVKQVLDGNVVGLIGPNGRGKSTILQAIQFALTGTIDHQDALQEFIREEDSEKPPKKASVVLNFEADGKKGTITRHITRSSTSRELVWEGIADGKPVSADKKVSELMFQILGVDKRAINSTVFIKQGAISNMFGKDTERREFYTRLLMLGHLEKVADVVDGYRKQIGDSVQDLSAIRDDAEKAYNTAADFFEACDAEVKASHPWVEESDAIARVVAAFTEQAEAEHAIETAKAALAPVGGSGAENLEATITQLTAKAEALEARKTQIDTQRVEWTRETAELFAAKDRRDKAIKALEAYGNIRQLQSDLASHQDVLSAGNPNTTIASMQTLLASLNRIEELPELVASALAKSEAAAKVVEEATAERGVAEVAYRAALMEFNTTTADLEVRENILEQIAGEDISCGCLVCGSKSPDLGFLRDAVDRLKVELDKKHDTLQAATADGKAARTKLDAAQKEATEAAAAHKQFRTELISLRSLVMGMPDKATAEAQLTSAKEALAAFNVAESETRRISRVLQDEQSKVAGIAEPTAVEVQQFTDAYDRLNAASTAWDSGLDTEADAARVGAADCRRKIDSYRSAVTGLAEAKSRLQRAEQQLADTLTAAAGFSDTLGTLLAARGVMTMQDARELADEVRANHTAHEQLIGKRVGAKQGMVDADTRLNELELKIAEQKHRIKLRDDLVRIRDAFKPAGVTMDYLDYRFGKIAELAADYLAESQADFMVAASPDAPLSYEFVRLKPGEKWLTQSRLSGGQKVRLAVATLRAIHALVMPNVGLLVLDEPTTHLDNAATESMADMLRRIGSEGTLQMIVCDHDPMLIDAFSSTIDLSAD